MIQRLIFSALQDGATLLTADPTLIEDIFGEEGSGLTVQEVTAIRNWWAATPARPVHGYGGHGEDPPFWGIVLSGEQEVERALADEVGCIDDPEDPDFGQEVVGSIWSHTYQVLCFSDSNPDVCQYLYGIARAILNLARRDWVNTYGFHGIQFSGADLAPDPRYFPEHMFIRQLTVQVQSEVSGKISGSGLGKAWAVRGIHVDSSGSPSDAGEILTLVTVGEP